MIRLKDEEIRKLIDEAVPFYKPYPVNEWEVITKTQIKRMVDWCSGYCELKNRPRRECEHCWQALLEEIGNE